MRLATFLFLFLLPFYTFSDQPTLQIADYYGSETYPDIHDKLIKAANKAGINILFSPQLPANRALHMAAIGKLDGDILRHPSAVEDYPDLIKINVPILKLDYWVWVTTGNNCPQSMDQLKSLTAVGLLGFKYFDVLAKELNTEIMIAPTMETFGNMLSHNRANYTLVIDRIAEKFMHEGQLQLTKCFSQPYVTLNGYMYLHKKHIALIPQLEKAFKTIFIL